MPLGRNARQQRGRSARRDPDAWTPRIDVFGTLRLPGEADARCRLIEYAPASFAAFSAADPERPATFRVEGEFAISGRNLRAELEGGAGEVRFQKAGCGCETPQSLRGARAPLLAHLPAEPEAALERDNAVTVFGEPFG
jgi:hypothetical protein